MNPIWRENVKGFGRSGNPQASALILQLFTSFSDVKDQSMDYNKLISQSTVEVTLK